MTINSSIHGTTGTQAEVTAHNQLAVALETDGTNFPEFIGGVRMFGENDQGVLTGTPDLGSPETDIDYRQRSAVDLILDECVFNYTVQDTGKHNYLTSTMTNSWALGQMTTNSAGITTAASGTQFSTYATFPNTGTQTLSADLEAGFSAQPVTNAIIEFGLGIPGTALTPPGDGVYIRVSSAGVQGTANFNGSEVAINFPLADGAGSWVYTNNKKYQFIMYAGGVQAKFWVNDGTSVYQLGKINLPVGWARICMSRGMQLFIKHRNAGGVAGGVIQGLFGAYNVRLGGSNITSGIAEQGNRIEGSYQGFGGATLGTLARVGSISSGNETNVTAAVPTTTGASLGVGLGGTFWETATLALNTDGIVSSFQVPPVSISSASRRLVLLGLYLSSYVQTAVTGGPFTKQWFLAFGHTSPSLATAESASAKAPRRIPLPFTQQVAVTQAVQTPLAQSVFYVDFSKAPVYVNPGEYIQLCTRHLGTVGTAGVLAHTITPIYGWE
jgi:hypothetical protein